MFSKMLVTVDGSAFGQVSALEGVEMAKRVGAEVVGIYVSRELQNPLFDFSEVRPRNYPTEEEFHESVKAAGDAFLSPLGEAAKAAGVKFSPVVKISNATAQTIINTAKSESCDLIFMGSHGCAGLGNVLLGSVATKVLSGSPVPVLIYKVEREVPLEAATGKYNVFMVP